MTMNRTIVVLSLVIFCAAGIALMVVSPFGDEARSAGLVPTAQAKSVGRCSEHTVRGTYAFALTGSVVDVGPIAASGTTTFDGEGNVSITGAINTTTSSAVLEGTFTGTYTVNPDDCTAFAVVTTPGVFGYTDLHFRAVIINKGEEVRYLITDPGIVFAGSTVRQ
jgi:hypothetical protein